LFSFFDTIEARVRTVFGPAGGDIDSYALAVPVDRFLGVLEISIERLWSRRKALGDILELQSVLADDHSGFRIRNTGSEIHPNWQLQQIDNNHLRSEMVDRTFELHMNALTAGQGFMFRLDR
jgi:hypothetical protein